jgi:hypothetical protein
MKCNPHSGVSYLAILVFGAYPHGDVLTTIIVINKNILLISLCMKHLNLNSYLELFFYLYL